MSTLQIEQLRVPDTLGGNDAADFLAALEVSRQVRINTWGNDDLAYTAEEMLATCHDSYEWYVLLVARINGVIVGRAGIALPLADSTDLAHVTLDVLPSAQGHGVGRELLEAAETFVRGENRLIVMVETNHPAATLHMTDGERLPAANGVGDLPLSSREVLFAHKAGYDLEQVEQFGACHLPLAESLVDDIKHQAHRTQNGAYRLHQWVDHCPEAWAEDFVALESSITASPGLELVDLDDGAALAPAWTLERLREAEKLARDSGRRTLVTAAEHINTGALIGFTSISVLAHRSDVVFQDDTVVIPSHRRNDVGLLMKVSNMEQLAREIPQARTVYTWNAAENTHMLAVNARLGYAAAGVTGQWEKEFLSAH